MSVCVYVRIHQSRFIGYACVSDCVCLCVDMLHVFILVSYLLWTVLGPGQHTACP